ncbi:Ku protein [Pendulispora albinea]|uniref:Non-homologous end joining protein Ku n=1 Tax=Pendulispora albinea TaxID=2741071 RepID=A0ABZ2M8N6_9BACT
MRAMWSGEIAFGLVTIPAKLYSATKDLTPSFHQLHTECGSRISMVRRCPKCNRDIEWGEIGKGYEVSKGEYALFTKEELAKMDGEDGPGGIDIVEFIDPEQVDNVYFSKSYWVGPGGKSARGFTLLREALESTQRAALCKVRIRTRTQLAMLRPRGKLFALDMLRFADEIVPGDEIVLPDAKPASDRELQLALNLVEQLSSEDFDAKKHPDEYRAAVEAAAAEKVERDELARPDTDAGEEQVAAGGSGGKVIDLADLLARSLRVAPANISAPAKGLKKTEAQVPVEEREAEKKPKKRAAGKRS